MVATTYVETIWQFWLLRGVVVAVGFTIMGSYRPAYMLFIGFYSIAAAMLWLVRAPTPVRYVDMYSPEP